MASDSCQPLDWRILVERGCETHTTADIDAAFTLISIHRDTREILDVAIESAIEHNSLSILKYLVQNYQVELASVSPKQVAQDGFTSVEIVDFLISCGWSINKYDAAPSTMPFMWYMVHDHDYVVWCLEHGADVHVANISESREAYDALGFPPILELVAESGTVATFKHLLSLGAPRGWQTLHRAVKAAVPAYSRLITDQDGTPETGASIPERLGFAERMNMIRYLVDDLGMDVNASDPTHGTPLCYVADTFAQNDNQDEVTWFLLDRGARPHQAVAKAKQNRNLKFARAVIVWRDRLTQMRNRQ